MSSRKQIKPKTGKTTPWSALDPVQKGHNAERPLVSGAPTGRRIRGGLLPRVALGSYGASLTLGCIRLPLRGTKWTESQRRIRISSKSCVFQENFTFVVNQPGSILSATSKSSDKLCCKNEPFCPLAQFVTKHRIFMRRRRITMLNPRL